LQMPHIQRGFLSLPCCVLHRIGFAVVSEWYQTVSLTPAVILLIAPGYLVSAASWSRISSAPATVAFMRLRVEAALKISTLRQD
jgi:hypothetical protein